MLTPAQAMLPACGADTTACLADAAKYRKFCNDPAFATWLTDNCKTTCPNLCPGAGASQSPRSAPVAPS